MATYKQIQDHVNSKSNFTPKTCWIADVKEQCGLPVRKAWNRSGEKRTNSCPKKKIKPIKEALEDFKMI